MGVLNEKIATDHAGFAEYDVSLWSLASLMTVTQEAYVCVKAARIRFFNDLRAPQLLHLPNKSV